MTQPPRWGEIWDVDFGPGSGHEQSGRRSALVVSSDWFNRTRAELAIVAPISSTLRQLGTHVRVDPPEGGIDVPSDVMCEHARSVSFGRMASKRGELSQDTLNEVVKRLKVLFLLGSRA